MNELPKIEEFIKGQFNPTPEEIEDAREKGGEEAVEELKKRMNKATGQLRENRPPSEETTEVLKNRKTTNK